MPDASHDFGAHLRQAREQRGVSLHDIATRTKIAAIALEALEKNDTSRLPGGIFTRAFVRAYAQEVGLDPEDTVRRFLARFPDESSEEGIRRYEPNPDHISVDEPPTFGRAWRAVAWSVPLLLVVAYFGFGGRLPWWGDRSAQPATAPMTPPPPPVGQASLPATGQASLPATGQASLPANPQAPLAAEAGGAGQGESAAATADNAAAAPGQTAVVPPPVATTPTAPAPAPPPATAAVTPPPSQAEVPAATPGPLPAGSFRLTLAPREACWVSVRSNGASIFSSLMRPGERKELTLQGDVNLTVGNAGAFVYFINDLPGRALGGPGQVASARLNAENVKTFLEPR